MACHPVVPVAPGSFARQYRVQYHLSHDSTWRAFGSFLTRELAEQWVHRLHQQGYAARLLRFHSCPAA